MLTYDATAATSLCSDGCCLSPPCWCNQNSHVTFLAMTMVCDPMLGPARSPCAILPRTSRFSELNQDSSIAQTPFRPPLQANPLCGPQSAIGAESATAVPMLELPPSSAFNRVRSDTDDWTRCAEPVVS